MAISKYSYQEFSGGVQRATTSHIRKPNEVRNAANGDFSKLFGAITRRPGTEKLEPKLPEDKNTLGAIIARFGSGSKIFAAQNKSGDEESAISYWNGTSWEEVYAGLPANADIEFMDDLGELWVGSYDEATDTIGEPFTIDEDLNVSTTRQLYAAPRARQYMEFNGAIYAANVDINGERYPDRVYKSSGPMGAITFVRAPQVDLGESFDLIDQVPAMISTTEPVGQVLFSTQFNTGSEAAFRAFDANINTRWTTTSGNTTGFIGYDFGVDNPKIITHYSIRSSHVADNMPRSPKGWVFEGSNNGSSWTVLDTKANQSAWAISERRVFATTNTTSYRYYRIRITANQGHANYLTIGEIEFMSSPTNVNLMRLELDSARYVKPGMPISIYKAGTDVLKYKIVVESVNKVDDYITFLPFSQSFVAANVNTSTNVITIPSASEFNTGDPIKLYSTSTMPAPLTSGTTYFVIKRSATEIQVATTKLNAEVGNPISITSAGGGTMRVQMSYDFGNKDELWKTGRKSKLTRFWNVDYRYPEKSDYIKLPAAIDSRNDITALGKISSRMFVFTETSMFRFDGTNQVLLRNDVGCVAQKSIAYYDSYMVWLDQIGRIWIRNEEEGVQDVISVAIQDIIDMVPQEQLKHASGVVYGTKYKLHLGTVNGQELRVVYNFQTNTWSPEFFDVKMPVQFLYLHDGNVRPHFFDETGQLWLDESGDTDDGKNIPLEIELGDDTFGIDERKDFVGVAIYSKNSAATRIQVSLDGGQFVDIGQITQPVERLRFAGLRSNTGTMINIKIVNSSSKDPVEIHKMVVYYNRAEDTFNATKR